MSFRLTAVLFGAVLVLGLVLLGLALWGDDDAATAGALMPRLAGVKPDDVTGVEVERPDGSKLVLERAGKDGWRLTEPVVARADAFAVTSAVSALLDAKPTAYPELSANPAVHGLDKPLRVTLTATGGRTGNMNLGAVTIGGAKAVAFVTTRERTRPMAVPRTAVDALLREARAGDAGDLAKWTNDYRAKEVFSDARGGGEDVNAVKLTLPNKGNQELALTRSGAGWTFAAPAGWGDAAVAGDTSAAAAPNTITGVRPLLAALTGLRAAGPDDFLPDPKDLKEYGLDPGNPDLLRVELTPKDGKPEVVFVGKKADATPPAPGSFAPPAAKVYVRVEGVPGVIRATAGPNFEGVAAVVTDPARLRDRDLLKDDLKARTDAIDITVGKDTVKLRKVGPEWKLFGGPNDPQPANQKAVADLLGLLARPGLVKEFPAPRKKPDGKDETPQEFADRMTAAFAGNEPKAEVKLWADAVEPNTDPKADPKAEPKLKANVNPTVLQFGARDAAGVFVRRTLPAGAKADFVLPNAVKVVLTDPAETDTVLAVGRRRLDLLDPALKDFIPSRATRLTVSQGPNVSFEVVKEKGGGFDGAWVYARPDDRKGRPADASAVGELLMLLETQQAGRFVAEQPSKEELARLGLTPEGPRLKAVVGLEVPPLPPGLPTPIDPDGERVFFFGNDTDDKQGVYARVAGREAAFTVPRLVYDRLAGADLRDKTVVKFDPTKVKGVAVRGWKGSAGAVVELAFERKGGTWAVAKSTLPGYAADQAKVDKFVAALAGLRARGFVPGPVKGEYKLIPEDGGLEVRIDLDGQPGVVVFVGGPADAGALYAQVSTLPANDNVVTVPDDPLKAYRDSPASFAK